MIVADTNLTVHFLIGGVSYREAQRAFIRDSNWHVPSVWKSEFRNVLVTQMRHGLLSLDLSLEIMQRAEFMMSGKEHQVLSSRVLFLAANSNCAAYDCEFVALAQELGVRLVTADSRILSSFPTVAASIADFGA